MELSYDMLYLVSGPFLLFKNPSLLDENARSVYGIVRKVYILGKIPFNRDCKWVYCEHFGGRMSSPSCSVLEIGFCPNMDIGVAISLKYLPYDVS